MMPTFPVSTVCIAAVVALVGCGGESPMNVQSPQACPQETPVTTQTEKTPNVPAFVCTQFPAGNDQTRKFLAWAKDQYAVYCTMELDTNGDCVELNIHPCWPTKDQELKVISELKCVQSLSFYATSITDDGLRHLETMPALKKLWMVGASQITDEGLERLKRAKPDLTIDLPYRKAT